MLLSEFETLTDIYPDVNLYRAIEHEYNEGDWESKAQFCNAYKFNEGELANRVQAIANQRLIDTEEQHKRAVTDAANRVRELCAENAKLEARIEELEQMETAQLTDLTDLEATMLQSLRDMADDEFQRDEIGTALIGYDYLLKRLEVATI